jgi:prolyl oligopeptidase
MLLLFLISSINAQWPYPPTPTVDSSDTYWGKTYKDPYRWMENIKSQEVEHWFKAEANLTDSLLARIPARDSLIKEWKALDKLTPANYSDIIYEGNRLFYKKINGGENVGKLYYREGWDGKEILLYDPSTYRPGVSTPMTGFVPSHDGKRVALGLSTAGIEFSDLRFLNVDTDRLLPDSINPALPLGWTLDDSSIFYVAQNTSDNTNLERELNIKTKLHKLGRDPANDVDFFSNESYPELRIAPNEWTNASIDESYPDYIIGYAGTDRNETHAFYAPTKEMVNPKMQWKLLCDYPDSLVDIEAHGDKLYAITEKNAPNHKLISTSVEHPEWAHAETLLPEEKDAMQTIVKSKDYLLAVYSNGIVGRLAAYHFSDGTRTEISLPLSGALDAICPDKSTNHFLVSISTWTSPLAWYDYDADKHSFTKSIFSPETTYPSFENLTSKEVEVPGHDGAMIPLSIIYKKGLPKNGTNCCLLSGYGSLGISSTPKFDICRSIASWGVVLAVAHVRGGGEKGDSWYRAGYKSTKPNTWKDFISCGEYLVKNGYTSPSKLAGTGRSAGGILISRAITERPDLFSAAICDVGCANIMRYEFTPNGPVNIPEFGTVRDSAECLALYEMDGVQHVHDGVKYPAVICVGGWNDPRVIAWQPGKFAAALQRASSSTKPVLMMVNYDSGHSTEDKEVKFRNYADEYSFILWQTGHPDFQPAH